MEMHQLRYFQAVCEMLNFTRAAEQCHVSQPSLTHAIKKLEDELGGALFHRERGRIRLTGLGRMLRPHAEQVLTDTQTIKNTAHHFLRLEKTPLNLGVMITIGPMRLSRFLSSFQGGYPGIEVELSEGNRESLLKRVEKGSLDAAVIGVPESLPASLAFTPLYQERYVVAFPTGHHFGEHKRISLAQVSNESYLDRLSCEFRDTVMSVCKEKDVRLYATYRSEREDWIQGMILAGMGVAFLPEYSITMAGIDGRPLINPGVKRKVGVVTAREVEPSPSVATFLREIKAYSWRNSPAR